MTDVTLQPEKQIEQVKPQIKAQEASVKVANARDAMPGTQPAESLSNNEKLKLATEDVRSSATAESRLSQAKDASDKAYPPGIESVEVSRLPSTPDVRGPQDFKGNTPEERQAHYESLKADMLRHEEMRPFIEQGYGPDTWEQWDQQKQIGNYSLAGHERGYSDAYRAYYDKSNCITVSEANGQCNEIINGRHRIFIARELNIQKLPMYVQRA
jgi:hypothetical protein